MKSPEKQSFARSATALAIMALLSGRCGTEAQNNIAEENDQSPPAGTLDEEKFIKADIDPNIPEKELAMEMIANDAGVIVLDFTENKTGNKKCDGMVQSVNDAGVIVQDYLNDGPECP